MSLEFGPRLFRARGARCRNHRTDGKHGDRGRGGRHPWCRDSAHRQDAVAAGEGRGHADRRQRRCAARQPQDEGGAWGPAADAGCGRRRSGPTGHLPGRGMSVWARDAVADLLRRFAEGVRNRLSGCGLADCFRVFDACDRSVVLTGAQWVDVCQSRTTSPDGPNLSQSGRLRMPGALLPTSCSGGWSPIREGERGVRLRAQPLMTVTLTLPVTS